MSVCITNHNETHVTIHEYLVCLFTTACSYKQRVFKRAKGTFTRCANIEEIQPRKKNHNYENLPSLMNSRCQASEDDPVILVISSERFFT